MERIFPMRQTLRGRLFGVLMIIVGLAGWWCNWHLAKTEGHFYIKLCILGPLGLFGGLLVMVRPDWMGPLGKGATRAHKTAVIGLIAVIAVVSGIDYLPAGPPLRPPRSGDHAHFVCA